MKTYLQSQKQISGWLTTGSTQLQGGITKGQKECFRGDAHYLDYGDGFMDVHISQNVLNCTL